MSLSFKEAEVRIRRKARLPDSIIEVKLMRKAFKFSNAILTDITADAGEQVATMGVFAEAIGMCKNPSSHRDVAILPKKLPILFILPTTYPG